MSISWRADGGPKAFHSAVNLARVEIDLQFRLVRVVPHSIEAVLRARLNQAGHSRATGCPS
jgi:hypothetical protein